MYFNDFVLNCLMRSLAASTFDTSASSSLEETSSSSTVIQQVAVAELALTIMVVVPAVLAVTYPFWSTLATELLVDDHCSDTFAPDGGSV